MNVKQPGIEKSRGTDDQQCHQPQALLDDLAGDYPVSNSTADLDVDQPTLTASPCSERLTRRMRVALDNTGRKLSWQETLHRLRRVLSAVMWQSWRQRAKSGFQLAYVSSIEK